MQGFVTLKAGWVFEVYIDEMGLDYDARVASGQIPVGNSELIRKLIYFQPIMFYDGVQFCQVKNPKDIWRRLRSSNITGIVASLDYQKYISNLDSNFPDIPSGTIIGESATTKKRFEDSFEFEFRPGLKICQSTEADADIWESSMIASQLYTKEEAWKLAIQWLSDPLTWNTKVVWNDKILQLENYHFQLGSTVVWNGFQTRTDRTRPSWFYKQMAKPLLQALYREGIETVMASIRSDRQDWADYLKEAYGSEQLKVTDKGIIFRTRVKDSLALIPEWPARRTLGPGWKWEQDGILIREATDADVPTISKAIDDSWGTNPRKQLAIDNFEAQWNLDSASILLILENGEITEARTFRERKDPTINLRNNLLRTSKDTKINVSNVGILEWQKGVGYKTTSFIIETKLVGKMTWLTEGWTVYSQNDEITEMRRSI